MNPNVFSNTELTALREELNAEILRRGTFRWWDPLTRPTVGQDLTPPLSLPEIGDRLPVDEKTYTINMPSEGALEPTRNIQYPAHGIFPAGEKPGSRTAAPSTSAAQINVDELRNALIGLAKIHDINLFYGRDEIPYLAFRDPSGIESVLREARMDDLSVPLGEAECPIPWDDPNGGRIDHKHEAWPHRTPITFPTEQGKYVMPSGESDGEEVQEPGLGPENFFDDYGAPPGVSDYHPINPAITASPNRDQENQGRDRGKESKHIPVGSTPSSKYGPNPRNPKSGESYPSRLVYSGVETSCNVACTGLCYLTCDNQCSESCTTTCWNRCGEACTASCGNVCTGCSSMCYDTCKTKCETAVGYSCLKAGAKTVKITALGGHNGIPAKNELIAETYTCTGCAYTCQFYPNKRTTCWDAACMGKCFNTCESSCSTSCFGGCVGNEKVSGEGYTDGHGQGCSAGCTLNCAGTCSGVCVGFCIHTCWHACKSSCADNCVWTCSTDCGTGCEVGCTQGCDTNCVANTVSNTTCKQSCDYTCEHGCNTNCVSIGCRSICGTGAADACESNCRLNCTSVSCTAMCSDACVNECSTCVNTCGFQCGTCSSMCSTGCEADCNINCTANCAHSCDESCIHSCSEACGGCSNLCYSCVGMCVGLCSFKCEVTCTNCTNQCSWWCDTSCSRSCFANCSDRCINNCSGSCATYLMSDTTHTLGPERDPTSTGYQYPHPRNRWEERESFKLFGEIAPYEKPQKPIPLIRVEITKHQNIEVTSAIVLKYMIFQTSVHGGIYTIDPNGKIVVNTEMLLPTLATTQPNLDGGDEVFLIVMETDGTPFTREDILYRLPIGFRGYYYGQDDLGREIVIIERDIFLYQPDESCDECMYYQEMTELECLEIWRQRRDEFQEGLGDFLTPMSRKFATQVWKEMINVNQLPDAPACECGSLKEITAKYLQQIWKEGLEDHE